MEYLQDSHGLLRNLQIYKIKFKLQATTHIKLPPYKGSTFKGVFGHQLRKIFCTDKDASNCRECLVFQKCPYVYLYESPLPRGSQILCGTLPKNAFSDPALIADLLKNNIILTNQNNTDRVRFNAVLDSEERLNARLAEVEIEETAQVVKLWRKAQVKKDIFPPLIIEPPLTTKEDFVPGDCFEMNLVLTGRAIEYLPFLMLTFIEIGKSGVGKQIHRTDRGWKKGGTFTVDEVRDTISGGKVFSPKDGGQMFDNYLPFEWSQAQDKTEQHMSDNLTLRFLTPVRIKENKKLLNKFNGFGQFISHLYWRLILLAYFYSNPWEISDERFLELGGDVSRLREEFCGQADKDVNYPAAETAGRQNQNNPNCSAPRAQGVEKISVKLEISPQSNKWREFRRWSNRQNDEMLLGGFVGDLKLSGNLAPYLPLLYFGEHIHLGKQTTFGLGQYEIIKPDKIA